MTHFDHPKSPVRHAPTVSTAEVGARVTCVCGWSATAPTAPGAARAYVTHHRDEKAKEGGEG